MNTRFPSGAGSGSHSLSSSFPVNMPSALASSASASASDRTVSPVTSVTGGATSRGEEDNTEKEKKVKKGGSLRVASASASASTTSNTETAITTPADTSAVRRSSRARTSLTGAIGTYNVDVLADRHRKRARKGFSRLVGFKAEAKTGIEMGMEKTRGRSLSASDVARAGYVDSRNVSGETLVNDDDDDDDNVKDLREGGVRLSKSVDSLQNSDTRQGMELQRIKEKSQQKHDRESGKIVRRQPTRLQHAASSAKDVVSMLGKRGREAMESGMDKAQALGRSGSTRLRDALRTRTGSSVAGTTAAGGNGVENIHPAKKARLSFDSKVSDAKEMSPVPVIRKKPRAKRWLTSGLYTGQERDLNPRLKQSKNKLKRGSGLDGLKEPSQAEMVKPRKHMPMPMFAGERLLERGRPFSLPYDVFSPLSERQAKPNEWRKTSRSMYLHHTLSSSLSLFLSSRVCAIKAQIPDLSPIAKVNHARSVRRRRPHRLEESTQTRVFEMHLHRARRLRRVLPEQIHALRV